MSNTWTWHNKELVRSPRVADVVALRTPPSCEKPACEHVYGPSSDLEAVCWCVDSLASAVYVRFRCLECSRVLLDVPLVSDGVVRTDLIESLWDFLYTDWWHADVDKVTAEGREVTCIIVAEYCCPYHGPVDARLSDARRDELLMGRPLPDDWR